MTDKLGFEIRLTVSRDDAIDKVTDALEAEGFGVLTTMSTRVDAKFTRGSVGRAGARIVNKQ